MVLVNFLKGSEYIGEVRNHHPSMFSETQQVQFFIWQHIYFAWCAIQVA